MTSIAANNDEQEQPTYTFYKKYLWKQIAADSAASGQILRTIYCQFGKWCVEKGFRFGDDDFTKLFWLEKIVSFSYLDFHMNHCMTNKKLWILLRKTNSIL